MPGEFEEAEAERDWKGENKEEDHSGHLGPSHPTLGHREEFGFSFK